MSAPIPTLPTEILFHIATWLPLSDYPAWSSASRALHSAARGMFIHADWSGVSARARLPDDVIRHLMPEQIMRQALIGPRIPHIPHQLYESLYMIIMDLLHIEDAVRDVRRIVSNLPDDTFKYILHHDTTHQCEKQHCGKVILSAAIIASLAWSAGAFQRTCAEDLGKALICAFGTYRLSGGMPILNNYNRFLSLAHEHGFEHEITTEDIREIAQTYASDALVRLPNVDAECRKLIGAQQVHVPDSVHLRVCPEYRDMINNWVELLVEVEQEGVPVDKILKKCHIAQEVLTLEFVRHYPAAMKYCNVMHIVSRLTSERMDTNILADVIRRQNIQPENLHDLFKQRKQINILYERCRKSMPKRGLSEFRKEYLYYRKLVWLREMIMGYSAGRPLTSYWHDQPPRK